MKVTTVENAQVLIPNVEHKNFTASDKYIPKGTELHGEVKIISGLRKGKPFQYRLFYTNSNEIIYTNKIKPTNMETTEVKLGADATVVNIPKPTLDRNELYGTILGAIAAFSYCAYKGKSTKEKLVYSAIGAGLGFLAGKMITKKKGVTIKK